MKVGVIRTSHERLLPNHLRSSYASHLSYDIITTYTITRTGYYNHATRRMQHERT
jgi:hypothetical protein